MLSARVVWVVSQRSHLGDSALGLWEFSLLFLQLFSQYSVISSLRVKEGERRSGESRGGTAGARGLQHLPMRWGHPQSSHQLLWLKDRSFTVRETVPPGDTAEPECWGQDRAVEDGAPLIKPQGERRCGACRGR